LPAAAKRTGQFPQLHTTESSCDIGQAKVVAEQIVTVTLSLAVRAEQPELFGQLRVRRCEHAPFAGRHILGGIKGIADDVRKRSHIPPVELSAVSLRGIPHHSQIVPPCDANETRNIRRAAKQMDGRKSFGAARDVSFDFDGSKRVGFRIDVCKHRLAPSGYNHRGGCGEGEIRNDDFVAGFEQCLIGDEQSSRSGANRNRKTSADGSREFLFKVLRDVARTQVSAFKNFLDGAKFLMVEMDLCDWNLVNALSP
jgi:hypothetical protein